MNSNKPITNIVNQLKRIKCFECGSYLVIKGLSSSNSELKFECNCKLFNYLLYIYFKDTFDSSEIFYIRYSNSIYCIIYISKTYKITLHEDIKNSFTKEIMNFDYDEATEEGLFNMLNNNLQIYSKLQKNLIFK